MLRNRVRHMAYVRHMTVVHELYMQLYMYTHAALVVQLVLFISISTMRSFFQHLDVCCASRGTHVPSKVRTLYMELPSYNKVLRD